jgi:hypothetical protein
MVKKQYSRIKLWFKNLEQRKTPLFLIIVPLLLFVFMLFRLAEIHFFYQGWYDPVYAYLMNGLTFALGSNDIGHIDHPGTPLQLFCAFIIRLTGFLRGTNDLTTDVLINPESYLRIISISLIFLNCFFLWILGLYAFKNLKNRNLAILIQLLPIFSFELIKFLPIVACESVVTFSSIAIASCIILFDGSKGGNKWLLIFIIFFSALSVSTKISSLVILIVPFFFFKSLKTKTNYLLFTILLIVLFISPVMDKMGNFIHFIKGIATHTGSYGTGEAKLIDWTIYFESIKKMVLKEFTFTLHLLLLPVGWFVIVKRKICGSRRRLYIAITLATIIQMLVVGRHYSFHYLIPIFALVMPLHGYFWIKDFQEKIGNVSTRIATLVTIVFVVGVFTRLIIKNRFESGLINPVEKTVQKIKKEFKGSFIILTDNNNGGAFIEPALRFGCSYSGNNFRKRYVNQLASIYPGNFLWNCRDGFTNWTGSYLPSEVFSRKNEIYLYGSTGKCGSSMLNISDMINQVGMAGFVKLQKVYQDERSGEVIVLARVDTALITQYAQPNLVIETGMEELTADGESFISNKEGCTFNGGQQYSNRFARDGKSSMLLTPSKPYGLNISIPVSKGKRYKVEFWQRSKAQKQAFVVASASKSELFYRTSLMVDNQPNKWTRSELTLTLPEGYIEKNINFYLWNPEDDSIWVDDLKLMVFE